VKQDIDEKVNSGYYRFESVVCSVCGEDSFDMISEKDRYGLFFPVKICRSCGLIQTNPRMTQESYNEFYANEYRHLYEGRERPSHESFQLQYRRGCQIVGYVRRFLLKRPEETTVVEIGCGSGGVLQAFRENGFKAKGVDLGEEYLRYGIEEYGLDLTPGTIKDIDLSQPPDLIVYSHVLEHILDLNAELSTINSLLGDDGMLFVEVPGVKFIQHTYAGDFLRLLQNAHTYHFTLQSLTNLAQRNGFSCLAGDEYIRALFVPSQSERLYSPTIVNDYLSVMSFLTNVEFEYLMNQGLESYRRGDLAQAAIQFAELIDLRPTLPYLYRLFAATLWQLGRVEDAERISQATAFI
jgi:2-polyprenyl-3-methyl-5-hydroxy-6-metoxy-1,4-benzoquinol methylase